MTGMLNNYHLHHDLQKVIAQQIGSGDKIAIKDKLCATGVMLTCNQQTIKQYHNLY